MQYNVKENGAEVRFVWSSHVVFRPFDVGRHRSCDFGKTNQAPIQIFDVSYFLYKLRSLAVERHITSKYLSKTAKKCILLTIHAQVHDGNNKIMTLIIGAFDFKRRCTEWSVYDIKVPRER